MLSLSVNLTFFTFGTLLLTIKLTNHDYVSTDHEAYVLGEASNKIHQCWSLVRRPSQDETLRSERTQEKTDESYNIRQIDKKVYTVKWLDVLHQLCIQCL